MQLPQANAIRVTRLGHPLGGELARLVCEPGWRATAKELKRTGRSLVLCGPGPGSGAPDRLVLKVQALDRPLDWLASMLGLTKLDRQWRGAQRLARAGFATPVPLVQFRGVAAKSLSPGPNGTQRVGCLLLSYVEGRTLLEAMARPGPEDPILLARALGRHIGLMLKARLFNRDHKPSNLLLPKSSGSLNASRTKDESPDARGVVVVLDPVGVRRMRRSRKGRRRARTRARRRMLFALLVEPLGVGVEIGLRLRLETMHACAAELELPRRVVREDFRAIDQMLFEHGDPTPQHDPLTASADDLFERR